MCHDEAMARFILVTALVLASLGGCGSGGRGSPVDAASEGGAAEAIPTARSGLSRVTAPMVSAADGATLAADDAAFALAAYRQLVTGRQNVVFSPVSISLGLAMAYAGAAGATASQMATALHFTLPPESLHAAFNALDRDLTSRSSTESKTGVDPPLRLSVANAAWADRSITIEAPFLDTLALNYGAGVKLLDFIHDTERARVTINDWVAAATGDLVKELLAPGVLDVRTRLVLTDALAFQGAWAAQFAASNTSDGAFTLLDSRQVTAPFMARTTALPALQGTGFVAVALPYTTGKLSLLLVVPEAGSFTRFEAALDTSVLDSITSRLTRSGVELALPRFAVETGSSLVPLLRALGMIDAFDENRADFSRISRTFLYIKDVVEQATIDVSEKGTRAGAGTGVVFDAKSDGGVPRTVSIRVDRPFLFFLRDEPTGAILFMGRVLDPTAR
jgi:serpin B